MRSLKSRIRLSWIIFCFWETMELLISELLGSILAQFCICMMHHDAMIFTQPISVRAAFQHGLFMSSAIYIYNIYNMSENMLTGAKPRDPVMDGTMQAKAESPGHCTMHQAFKIL